MSKISASLMCSNPYTLQSDIQTLENTKIDYLHMDIMDGHFVPNLTIGPVVVESVAKASTKPLDIHLMVQNNNFFVDLFAPFKPKYISFHIEEEKHSNSLAQKIRNYGISPAIVLNPHTSLDSIYYLLEYIDMVLVMSVNPGFGGQKFISNTLDKIKELKDMLEVRNPNCLIEVDGGVSDENILELKKSGVDIAVAGSYIFSGDYKERIKTLRV